MILGRWNRGIRDYEPYRIPDDRRIRLHCDDVNELIDCVSCGRELTFGEAFTSLEFHTPMGFGYGVCPECYEEERRRYHGKG